MNCNPTRAYSLVVMGAVLHFLVDGLCLCCLYLMAGDGEASGLVGVFIAYNMLAFLTQPLTGLLADRLRQPHWLLLLSVLLLSVAVLLAPLSLQGMAVLVPLSAVLLGVGNSLFHVWGGRQTVVQAGNDMRALGLFVSTGAFGLAVAMVYFSWGLLMALLLALCLFAMTYVWADRPAPVGTVSVPVGHPSLFGVAVVALVMLVVATRSYVSGSFSPGGDGSSATVLLVGAAAMLGKMLGGWVATALGWGRAFVLMAVGVVVCYFWRAQGLPVVLAGLFLVNATMPVTLYLANRALPGREALAFGLLAAALMPGYLLAMM